MDGRILAVADRLDTLAGIFVLGKKPSGNRDPFGLRRAALGIIRVLVECELDVDLKALIKSAVDAQPKATDQADGVSAEVYAFIADRLRRYFLDRDAGLATETFDAVLARQPASLVDFERRLDAVQAFIALEPAASLAAANKRVANILRKAEVEIADDVKEKLLAEPAEQALAEALESAQATVAPMLEAHQYTDALTALAGLRAPIDAFFDDVMVMADDKATRNNRLALLNQMRTLFLDIADISRLSI
jgi:glycyl-tRNA synthetase beta chain